MSRQYIGIEEARKTLGDLVTAAQQGTDTILTRNRRPVARITAYQEDPMVTIPELTAELNLPAAAQERVTRFTGAFSDPAVTVQRGQIPKRWEGQGLAAEFTRGEADALIAQWHDVQEYRENAEPGEDGEVHGPYAYERVNPETGAWETLGG